MRDVNSVVSLVVAACCLAMTSTHATAWEEHDTSNNDVCVNAPGDDESPREFFRGFPGGKVPYLGPDTTEPFAFRHYNESEVVLGKPMREWLTFSVAFWHSIRNNGADPFGHPTKHWPWDEQQGEGCASSGMVVAKRRMRAMFELMRKLGVDRWCFHDRDIAPVGRNLAETNANLDAIADHGEASPRHPFKAQPDPQAHVQSARPVNPSSDQWYIANVTSRSGEE